MNKGKMYLFIFIVVFKISAVIVIDMVYAEKDKDKEQDIQLEENIEYGYFKCVDANGEVMYYDQKFFDYCIEMEVSK